MSPVSTAPEGLRFIERTIFERYWQFNPSSGLWERNIRKRTILEPVAECSAKEIKIAISSSEELKSHIDVDVAKMTIDVAGINVEKLRCELIEAIEKHMNGEILDAGKTSGNTATLETQIAHGELLLVHSLAATVNKKNNRVRINVATRGFHRQDNVLVALPEFVDRDLADKFLRDLKEHISANANR